MTFTPIPPQNLITIAALYERLDEFNQNLLSYLTEQQATNAGLLASVSDLYTRIGGRIYGGQWIWEDDAQAAGSFHVALGTGLGRRVSLNRIDADGNPVHLGGFGPGSHLVLMDDASSSPVTAFRQYVAASSLLDHGDWWTFDATRVATFGVQDIPADGNRITLLFS